MTRKELKEKREKIWSKIILLKIYKKIGAIDSKEFSDITVKIFQDIYSYNVLATQNDMPTFSVEITK